MDAAGLMGPLPDRSFFALLAEHGDRIVRDEDFAECYSERMGRPSIPPSLLAKVLLLQYRCGLSDEQAMESVAWDLRWKVALGLAVDHRGWHPTSLTKYRARLSGSGRIGSRKQERLLTIVIDDVLRHAGMVSAGARGAKLPPPSLCLYACAARPGGPVRERHHPQGGRNMSRIGCAVAALTACGVVAVLAAVPASAKTTTLHFFSKDVYTRLSDSSGKVLPSNSQPAVGDRLSIASNDYAGNHKAHAKKATASDHIGCTVNGPSTALCDGTIALGGAMLLGDDFVLNFASNAPTVVKITGGTGRYQHAHGTIVAKSVTMNTTDLTIKVTT